MDPFAPGGEIWNFGAVMSFIFGLIWGSFFNVCIYRIPAGKSVVTPGSHCGNCGTFIRWYDNIPLLSYLLLRGNCRSCGMHFSARYFFVELITGFLFLAVYVKFGPVIALPFHLIFVSMLFIGIFTDIDHFILPDRFTLGGAAFALVTALILGKYAVIADEYLITRKLYSSFRANFDPQETIHLGRMAIFLFAVGSSIFGYMMLAALGIFGKIVFRKEAMGAGDLKLFAFLGAYLGAINCVLILFLSAFVGAIWGLSLLAVHYLFSKDVYEELILDPARAVSLQDASVISQPVETPSPLEPAPPAATAGLIHLKIARFTGQQMRHIPYGPYIAVSAIAVLLGREKIHSGLQEFFFIAAGL